MIKMMALLFKKPGLTDEEFKNYWKGKHRDLAGKIIPGLRKYTQNHFIKMPGLKLEGDGFVELWFDDLEAVKKYLAWRQTAAAQPLLEDENKFLDLSKTVRYVVEEYFIIK
ncbi:MAG: EthD domain-containing protein [Thermodesulfobacteriota bacterium]|jgi:uncharacterized protein (TIGR02118 family)